MACITHHVIKKRSLLELKNLGTCASFVLNTHKFINKLTVFVMPAAI